jgi:subtilisin family serine protease
MHEEGFKGEGMMIAVLDNGFNGVNKISPFRHLWENKKIVATRDFVENTGNVFQFGTHGSIVLSVIAAQYENDTASFKGISPEAQFVLCITEDNQGENRIEEINWVLGAEFADSVGTDVINSSLGYHDFNLDVHDYSYEQLDGKTAISTIGATIAAQKGIAVVISAGNEGNNREDQWRYITPPADANGVLTVGSVDVDFSPTSFSSIGPTADDRIKPDVAALGNGAIAVQGNGNINLVFGTSYSAPLMAGFTANVWQANPEWTKDQLIAEIKRSGHTSDQPNIQIGHGVPNYNYIKSGRTLQVDDIMEDKIIVYPNPFNGDSLYISAKDGFKDDLTIRIMDPNGKTIYQADYEKKDLKKLTDLELSVDTTQQGIYYLFLQSGKNKKVVKLINF